MSAITIVPEPAAPPSDQPRVLTSALDPSDRIFRGILRTAGVAVLAITGFIGIFLLYRAWQALSSRGIDFFTTQAWNPDNGDFGIAGIITGTVLIALVAITIAIPLAVGIALYISEYAPKRIKGTLVSLVDLMAAIPSIVYGIWGLYLMQPEVFVRGPAGEGLPRWISSYLGWIPLFRVDGATTDGSALVDASRFIGSTFIAGVVVAMMVTPIIASIMREVFSQAPVGEREGAFALGATRWGMITAVVLPFGRGGMIGATMLGLGRALGETIGVLIVISQIFTIQTHIFEVGAISTSALIASQFGAASQFGLSALFAAGFVLFMITMVTNYLAAIIVNRSRSGAESDA